MDELMMKLLSIVADQVRSRRELFDEEAGIMQKLVSAGYPLHQADAAVTWMQNLVEKQAAHFFGIDARGSGLRIRTMNSEERRRFTPDAFVFAVKLTQLGVLSEDQREDVLRKAMDLYPGLIELAHIKTVVAFTLFGADQERTDASAMRMKDTVWN